MRWKRLAFSGLGAAALGYAAVLLGRRRKQKSPTPTPLPDPLESLRVETEPQPLSYRGRPYHSRALYTCKPSRFRAWGLLDQPAGDGPHHPQPRIPGIHIRRVAQEDSKQT